MQPTGGEMPPSMAACLNGSALHNLPNGQPQQRQQSQTSALQDYDHSAAAAGAQDDFLDQMLSSLPWVELNSASSKAPWDLAAANGGGEGASNGHKLFSVALAGKPALDEPAAGAEGLHYGAAAPYDESALLASRLRQHRISGGGRLPGKTMVPIQLGHASQQQHMLVSGLGRSSAAADSGLLPLPLSLGSGESADSRLLVDRSRDDVDSSFKSLTAAVGDGLFNRFGGSLQRATPPAAANQQSFHHPQAGAVTSQGMGGAGQAAAAGSAGGGAAAPRQRVRARRGQATDPHSIAERLRRERIAERMKALQELVPNANKTDKASMLDEIIDYVKFLQLQVKVLSMSRLGGAAAVVPLVADISSEASAGRGGAAGQGAAASGDGLAVTEHQVAKLMEDDIGSAMQYLQGKGLCLMPISLASAISATAGPTRAAAHPNGGGGNNQTNGNLLVPGSNADGPSSPSLSVLTVQSAMANGADNASAKDAACVSKP